MAVEYASPSRETQLIALKGFQQIARIVPHGVTGADGTPVQPEADVTLSMPHQVHPIGLDHLVERQSLTDSRVTSWRFLVLAEGSAVASSEVSAGTDKEKPSMLEQVNVGPYVQSTESALQALAEAPEVRSGRYELHMLKIPALSTFLLWLSQLDGDDHLFIALSPAPAFLEAGRIYREHELLDGLEGPARRCLELDDPLFGAA
ncbi:hypothetical protein ACFU8W_49385 [Streptomyces sp. NPDC057565]|uniref:hypothetical protein n=1 Tax=Streptomyces sp. NPDC057565 TaxID=3346169 RepID=UPI0036CF98D5